ncbi:Fc.00g115410.m01.CDS01 [Cosmosporella sp. VM-42]
MPGYGRSTARNMKSDYAQENVIQGMLAVLADTGQDQAIWVGHDWGCGTLWTPANTHPKVCRAVVGLCVPFGVLKLGLEEVVKTVDRDIYPEDQYPHGQWSYQVYYEKAFDKASAFFNKDIHGLLKALHAKGSPLAVSKPSSMGSTTVKDGGWMGGRTSPPPPEATPDDNLCMDQGTFDELVEAMEKTGFGPADSWCMNSKLNQEYHVSQSAYDGKLKLPVLFINARFDSVCETITERFARKMRNNCSNLTETIIDAGHWVASERPEETNTAIIRWLVEEVTDWWPAYWKNGWVKRHALEE